MLTYFSISTQIELAPFTEKRVEVIRTAFREIADPKTPLNTADGENGIIVLNNAETQEIVVISPNSIVYHLTRVQENIPFERIINPLMEIIPKLLLEKPIPFQVVIRYSLPSRAGDAATSSVGSEADSALNALLKKFKVWGLGKRYLLVDDNGDRVEYKIEPLLADRAQWFVEVSVNKTALNYTDLGTLVHEEIKRQAETVDSLELSLA